MPRKTRRHRNATPPHKKETQKRERGDVYFLLKIQLNDVWYDLLTVPHRDMIPNIVLEGVGNYIGEIEGIPADCPLLDGNEDAAKTLETLNIWSSSLGNFKIGTVYWIDVDS